MAIRIVTLGGFRVLDGDEELGAFQGQPLRSGLLVHLAVEGRTTRDRLVETFWPGKEVSKAKGALNSTLHELGRSLGEGWRDGRGDFIQAAATISVDAADFVAAVEREDHPSAFELYQGAFLDGAHLANTSPFEQWVDQTRSYLGRLHRRMRGEFVSSAIAGGDLVSALSAAQDWAELEPFEDEAHHRCIELLARTGNARQAVRHFDRYRERLAREMDLEPMAETVDLVERIRAGKVTSDGPSFVTASPAPPRATSEGRDTDEGSALPIQSASMPSLVVIPFRNHSPEADSEYFSDGMTEEIINTLSKLDGLRVAAATSSFALKGTTIDVREVGRMLGAAWVVEGGVRKFGSQLRISARLVNAADGFELWCDTFEREFRDVFAIQDEIAWAIAGSLAPYLGQQTPLVARPRNRLPEAYDLYLMGRHFFGTRSHDGLERAIHYYREALARDPDYAAAHAGVADALIAQAHFQYRPPRDVMDEAEAAAQKALELAPDLAEVQCTHAHIHDTFTWRWQDAEKGYRRAIALNPFYAHARITYADLLTRFGRHDESADQTRQAESLEPLSFPIKFQKGAQLYRARRFEDALSVFGRTLEMAPRHYPTRAFQGLTLVAMGRAEEAVSLIEDSLDDFHGHPALRMVMAYGLAASGRRAQAQDCLRSLREASSARYVPALLGVVVLGALDEMDAAFAALEKSAEERYPQISFLAVDPMFDSLARDRRFESFLDRLGLSRGGPDASELEPARRGARPTVSSAANADLTGR